MIVKFNGFVKSLISRATFFYDYFDISGNIVDISSIVNYGYNMALDYDTAATLFSQFGNKTRLKIVRELVRAGESGMQVGEIKKVLGIPDSTLSHHINHLRSVGLIWQEREGTILRCFVDYKKIDSIVAFLTEECCVAEGKYAK